MHLWQFHTLRTMHAGAGVVSLLVHPFQHGCLHPVWSYLAYTALECTKMYEFSNSEHWIQNTILNTAILNTHSEQLLTCAHTAAASKHYCLFRSFLCMLSQRYASLIGNAHQLAFSFFPDKACLGLYWNSVCVVIHLLCCDALAWPTNMTTSCQTCGLFGVKWTAQPICVCDFSDLCRLG